MVKPFLAALGLAATLSTNAAIIEFEFYGESGPKFGPVTTLTGSFLLDTSLATLDELASYPNGNLSRVKTSGGVYGFNLDLPGVVSGSPEVSSEMGGDLPAPDSTNPSSVEAFLNFSTAANSISFFGFNGTAGVSTLSGWNNSDDPIADFWLGSSLGSGFWCLPTHNTYYPRGEVCGTAQFSISEAINNSYSHSPSAVPVPAAAWLFGTAMLGLAAVGRNRN